MTLRRVWGRLLADAWMLGNVSIHPGVAYSAKESGVSDDVAKFIEQVVLVLYVQPRQKRAMRDAQKARRDAAKGVAR